VVFEWPSDLLPGAAPEKGPAPPVTLDIIRKALYKMKRGKAAGPSGVIAEMLKVTGEEGIIMLRHLTEKAFSEGVTSRDREESCIINLYNDKGDALDRNSYQGLKLTDQAMKLMEHVLDTFIHRMVNIDAMQFGFVPGQGTTLRQMQEKHCTINKPLYIAFVDLEKAFDCVPRKVLWWALRSLGVEEWAVKIIHAMYTKSQVHVNGQYSD
jgi:hypothetical protein